VTVRPPRKRDPHAVPGQIVDEPLQIAAADVAEPREQVGHLAHSFHARRR
jgi:hypothetical protein